MYDRKKRAGAAIELLRRSIREDSQDSFDFLLSVIEREQLFLECSDDDAQPIRNMSEFIKSVDDERLQATKLLAE